MFVTKCWLRSNFAGSLPAPFSIRIKIFNTLACPSPEVRQIRTSLSPLSIDPFTYISRTVPEFDPAGFAEGKKRHGIAINESHLFEINDDSGLFASEQFPKCVHILCANPPTHPQ